MTPQQFCSRKVQTMPQSMSVTYSFLLLLFLLFFLHACKARYLGTFDEKMEKKPEFFPKNNEKNGSDYSEKKLGLKFDKDEGLAANTENPMKRMHKVMKKSSSGALFQTQESLVSVSWSAPYKKNSEEIPGFSFDYSPPHAHPPSHNEAAAMDLKP